MLTPSFHSPCGRSSRGTWNTYAASPKALPTKSTATSDTPSTPGASQPACALECEEPLCPYGECGRRWPLTMREATTGARRQRRTRVLAPALAVRTAAGSRSAVLDVSMVCHALARVSVAAMSSMMRLGSSAFICRPHTMCATPIDLPYNLQSDLHNISVGAGIDFLLESGWKAADGTAFRASAATLVFPTKSPLNWNCACWPETPARLLAIRCNVCAGQLPFDTPRDQGAPSTIRCIKTRRRPRVWGGLPRRGQGAPSTIRCIKTRRGDHPGVPGGLPSGSTQHHQVH